MAVPTLQATIRPEAEAARLSIHHVGHVVADMAAGLELYRRLGFALPPPSYPAVAAGDGSGLRAFGATNTHADFLASFLEVVSFVPEGHDASVPSGARLVPLQAPAEAMPGIVAQIESTTANLSACLQRFEGWHILMFATSDIEAVAERLTAAGVGHGGVATVRRPVETSAGPGVEVVRVLELNQDSDDPPVEGRIGFAAALQPDLPGVRELTHPNGATGVSEVLLCVADGELDRTEARYQTYLDRAARDADPGRRFDLDDGGGLTLITEAELAELLPGERPVALPAIVGSAVLVEDLDATSALLQAHGLGLRRTSHGDPFVASVDARGVALIFRGRRVLSVVPAG